MEDQQNLPISGDKKMAQININRTMTAFEIETLISELAIIRANMLPAIPLGAPKAGDPGIDSHATVQDDPCVSVKLLEDKRIRLWVRNQGIGWMAFNFSQINACTIRDYLVANTPDNGNAQFFVDNDTFPNTSQ